jgi:hypothetical protein
LRPSVGSTAERKSLCATCVGGADEWHYSCANL